MCDCLSYNKPEWGGNTPEVILPFRKYFPKADRETVCVDSCIANTIERLWAAGVQTEAACCGHNGQAIMGFPNVVLTNPEDAKAARDVLATDGRTWWIILWAGPEGGEAKEAAQDPIWKDATP
jgi:hypothetical protein